MHVEVVQSQSILPDIMHLVAKEIKIVSGLSAVEDLLDARKNLDFDVSHGQHEHAVEATHGRRVCPHLHLGVPATLPATVGVIVRVGCGAASGLHLRQDVIIGANVAWTARRWVGVDRNKRQRWDG